MFNKLPIIYIIILIVPIALITLPWIGIGLGSLFESSPDNPEIKHGEFPFSLTYMIDGEVFYVEDTVICDYDGLGWNEGVGKYRRWKKCLASDGSSDLILLKDGSITIYCHVGKADYYMNDEIFETSLPFVPHIYLVDESKKNMDTDELLEQYDIKLLSWKFSTPLENGMQSHSREKL